MSIVFLGKGKDRFGYQCDILEDTGTKARYHAYSLEEWEERGRYLTALGAARHRPGYAVVGEEPTSPIDRRHPAAGSASDAT